MAVIKFVSIDNSTRSITKKLVRELSPAAFTDSYGENKKIGSEKDKKTVIKLSDEQLKRLDKGESIELHELGVLTASSAREVLSENTTLKTELEAKEEENKRLNDIVSALQGKAGENNQVDSADNSTLKTELEAKDLEAEKLTTPKKATPKSK